MIPKDGGNTFKGTAFFSGANSNLQSNNSDDARAKGLAAPDALNKVWDFNVAEGGPIKKDKLWFFASYRDWGVYQYIANSFFKNGDQTIDDAGDSQRHGAPDDPDRAEEQGVGLSRSHPQVPRPRELGAGRLRDCRRGDRHPRAEAVLHDRRQVDEHDFEQAAVRGRLRDQQRELQPDAAAGIARTSSRAATRSCRPPTAPTTAASTTASRSARPSCRSASYVTGSHALKAGIQYGTGYFWRQRRESGRPDPALSHRRAGAGEHPEHAAGLRADMNADMGIYVQDSWTIGRFTINPGVRFEHFNGSSPRARSRRRAASCRSAHFDEVSDLPNWNDVSPRFGFAWDIQGERQDRGEVRHRQVHARVHDRLRRHLRSELLQHRDADLERPEQGRHRAGRPLVSARRHPRAVRLSNRRLRDRFLDAAVDLRRQADARSRPTASSGRSSTRPTSAFSASSSPARR